MDEYDTNGKRSLGIIDVTKFRRGIEINLFLITLSHYDSL